MVHMMHHRRSFHSSHHQNLRQASKKQKRQSIASETGAEQEQSTTWVPYTITFNSGSAINPLPTASEDSAGSDSIVTSTSLVFVQPFPTTYTETYTPSSSSAATEPAEPAEAGDDGALSTSEVGAIAGSLGGLAFLLAVLLLFVCIRRKRRNIRETVPSMMAPSRHDPLFDDKAAAALAPADQAVVRLPRPWLDSKRQSDLIARSHLAAPPSPVSPASSTHSFGQHQQHSPDEFEVSPQDMEPLRFRPL